MTTTESNISINNDRISVELPSGKYVQFMAWDGIDSSNEKDIKNQIKLAFNICEDFESIEKHMKLNGYDVELEDIFE